jgi:hypothetical protein
MSRTISPMRGVQISLQDGAVSGDGLTIAIPDSFKHHTISIKSSHLGITAGAVQPETSNEVDYTGTWAQIGGGPITVVSNTIIVITFEGVYNFIRARISTPIVGGDIEVFYVGS